MKISLSKNVSGLLGTVVICLSLASCGKQGSRVQDVVVTTDFVEEEVHLALDVTWDMGNIGLPQIALPIYLPKTWENIGKFQMMSAVGGVNLVHLDINLSAITEHIQATYATLPNGNLLPLIGNRRTIVIPIQDKAEIYVTLGDGVAAIGFAVNIKGMDQMGASIGNASLFPVFAVKNVLGAAGLYTSAQAGESGIGFFADLSQVLDPLAYISLGVAEEGDIVQTKSFGRKLNLKAMQVNGIYPSKSKEKKINKQLYKMHKKGKVLQF